MKNLVWLIVVVLLIGWAVGFFAFPDVGGVIHVILLIAVILIAYKLLTGRRV